MIAIEQLSTISLLRGRLELRALRIIPFEEVFLRPAAYFAGKTEN